MAVQEKVFDSLITITSTTSLASCLVFLISEWSKIEERFEKKLSCWKAKYLSYGGRLVLLNSVLSSLPMFMMSCFGVLKNFDHFRSRFFWQGSSEKHKYRLANWDILCRPKDQGG